MRKAAGAMTEHVQCFWVGGHALLEFLDQTVQDIGADGVRDRLIGNYGATELNEDNLLAHGVILARSGLLTAGAELVWAAAPEGEPDR